jgi:D-glucosaminate-6-phosphate ammonia-lyase
MKIGKENMVGLVYALENYHQGQTVVTAEARPVAQAISAIRGLMRILSRTKPGAPSGGFVFG